MGSALAYHAVVHAMEGRAGISPLTRFSLAARHAIDGHLPYARYQLAGIARCREGVSPRSIERAVIDWLETDLNPAVQTVRCLSSSSNAVWGYNAYNASSPRRRYRTQNRR